MGLPIEKEVIAFQGMGRHLRKKKPDTRLAQDLTGRDRRKSFISPAQGSQMTLAWIR
jgi:hypothetical protein